MRQINLLSLICGENHMAYGQKVRLFGTQRGSGETVWEIKSRFGLVSNELHNKYVKGWKALDVVVSGLYDSLVSTTTVLPATALLQKRGSPVLAWLTLRPAIIMSCHSVSSVWCSSPAQW